MFNFDVKAKTAAAAAADEASFFSNTNEEIYMGLATTSSVTIFAIEPYKKANTFLLSTCAFFPSPLRSNYPRQSINERILIDSLCT